MARTLRVAVVQMEVRPAPTEERLTRAARWVVAAAKAGAQLTLLPELFNAGYQYAPETYTRAEPITGPTVKWMKRTAARFEMHVAGSLLLLDQDEIYNALLLVAPDGRIWRYDKNFPWGWERAYFRDSNRITVAQTDLGDIGMLTCWDTAHPELWARYAGRVDLMLLASSPPNITDAVFHYPGGRTARFGELNPLLGSLRGEATRVFGPLTAAYAAWLGVPLLSTAGCGEFRTRLPNSRGTLAAFSLLAPWMLRYWTQAAAIELRSGMVDCTRILDAAGETAGSRSQAAGEGLAVAEIVLADEPPCPRTAQPADRPHWLSRLISDVVLPGLTLPAYRQGARAAWGSAMAPADSSSRRWLPLLVGGLLLIAGLGFLWGRRR